MRGDCSELTSILRPFPESGILPATPMPTTPNPFLSLIVACAENRVIGRESSLPWSIPEDQAWFHDHTAGRPVILGRISYEVWPRAHLDGRSPIVVTSRPWAELKPFPLPAGVQPPPLARNVDEALRIAADLPGEVFVCGGEKIFEETLPLASRLYLTLVHADVAGDVKFPEWRRFSWSEAYRRESADETFRYTFSILEKTPEARS